MSSKQAAGLIASLTVLQVGLDRNDLTVGTVRSIIGSLQILCSE